MKSTSRKPVLRFPQFTNEWQVKRIDEIVEKVSILVEVNKSELYRQIGIRSHGKGIFHKEAVSGEELGNKRVFWVKEDLFVVNIVFAWEQAVAKTTKAEVGMIASHRFPMFKPLETISDLDFLLMYFLTKRGKALLEMASPGGAGRNKTLGQKEFEKLKINLPTFEEQQKIAAFLTAVDDKIQQLAKKKALLEQYKRLTVWSIFNQEIRFTDSSGNDFTSWQEKTIDEVTSVTTGATPSTLNKNYWGGDIRWMNSGELNLKRVYEVENRITQLGLDNSSTKILPKYCILIGLAGQGKTRGTVAMSMIELCTNQSIAAIHPNKQMFIEDFLYHNLDNRYDELRRLSTGEGGRGGLNLQIIKSLKLKLPSIPEQTKIAAFLSAIDDKINLVSQQLERTRDYKKGLLQQMFV